MNLYDLHGDPKSLKHHDAAHAEVPSLIWDKYQNGEILRRNMIQYRSVFAKKQTPPWMMTQYALTVLGPGQRFEEAEDEIAKDSYAAYSYSRNVLKKPWKKGEPAIAKDPEWAVQYAVYVRESRWPEAEKTIASEASAALAYAWRILNGPFPAGEKSIATDATTAVTYATKVLKRPFPLGEPVIATNAVAANAYATEVLGTRFPEGEKTIRKDPHVWAEYKDFFDIRD